MKNQALFSLKDKSKKIKCCLLHFLFGTLRVNSPKNIADQSSGKDDINKIHWLLPILSTNQSLTPTIYALGIS